MTLIYGFFALLIVYLFVGIPLLFFISACTLAFALLVSDARGSTRRPTTCLLLLSLINLTVRFGLASGSANSGSTGFDIFLDVAMVATPVLFLLTLLLPSTSHTDDDGRVDG